MDIPSGVTALMIVFTGASGNLNNTVEAAVRDVMRETPRVQTISGTVEDKIRVSGLSREFTAPDVAAIAANITKRTAGGRAPCSFTDTTPAWQMHTQILTFKCRANP